MLVAVDGKEESPSHGSGHYVATLVNVTNCRWDQALSTADLKQGSVVRSGESLHLLEGVAEINSTLKNGGLASLQLEGPLAMTLNSQGMPSLLYGHLTGKCACDYDQFALDTPLGRVNVSGDASIGVIAAANKVELHVFYRHRHARTVGDGLWRRSQAIDRIGRNVVDCARRCRRQRIGGPWRFERKWIHDASGTGCQPASHLAGVRGDHTRRQTRCLLAI